MEELSTGAASAGADKRTAVERLAAAIRYPDKVLEGALSATLRVDGAEITVEETSGRIMLMMKLAVGEEALPQLAAYAPGRMLREEATLAADPKTGEAFLWQDAPATADPHALARLFETFMDSCDWWRDRVETSGGEERTADLMEAVIRP